MSGILGQLAALGFAICGLCLVVGLKKWAARLGAVAVILAVGAGLAVNLGLGA